MMIRPLWQAALERALRRTFGMWERLVVHITPVHYFQPIPDTRRLAPELWRRTSELAGLDLREAEQVALLERLASRYAREWAFPSRRTEVPWQFHFNNVAFEAVDAEILYALVRDSRPRRILEIGAGYSSYVIAEAVRRNAAEGIPCEYVAIEPYPNRVLRRGIPGLTRLRQEALQAIPLVELIDLGEDDILFIDSTHVLCIGSDVNYEFLEILPRLRKGVLVHVHDVFLPAEYPRQWVMGQRRFWNEQYLLQAFLAFNDAFEVAWAGHFMHQKHPDLLERAFPSYRRDRSCPGSFWMRRAR
jgi:hypothetical protein